MKITVIKKISLVLFLNLTITLLVYFGIETLRGYLHTTYDPENNDLTFSSWLGFIFLAGVLLNFLLSYILLRIFKLVSLSTVLIVFAEYVVIRILIIHFRS